MFSDNVKAKRERPIGSRFEILQKIAFFFFLFLSTLCFAESNENRFVLQRIKSEPVDAGGIKVMLRTGRFARGVIYDATEKNVRGDFIQEAQRDMIIVSNALAKIITKDEMALTVGGEFLVDNLMNMTVKGSWNGKKDGAVHMLMGKITMFDYEFDSSSNYPLIFKMTPDGYEYQEGAGRIKDLQTGEIYILVSQGKATKEYFGKFVNRLACERECCELLIKGQIKQGITIDECSEALCK